MPPKYSGTHSVTYSLTACPRATASGFTGLFRFQHPEYPVSLSKEASHTVRYAAILANWCTKATRAMKNSHRQLGFWPTGFKGKIMYDTSKPDGQPGRPLDSSRAKSLFGFEATTILGEGIVKTLGWYRQARTIAARADISVGRA